MKILALDTSMGACSAAVLTRDGAAPRLALREEKMARGHAEALMPMVAEVMQGAGLAFAEIDLIAATLGPGSFTGVRIAIAAARGLALVTGAKLFGTDSLTVMAKLARTSGTLRSGPFAIAVDARRGMLYFGLYDAEAGKLAGPLLLTPDEAIGFLPSGLRVAAGAVPAFSLKRERGRDASSMRACPSYSRAQGRSPRSPMRAAKPCRRFGRFICALPTQSHKFKRC